MKTIVLVALLLLIAGVSLAQNPGGVPAGPYIELSDKIDRDVQEIQNAKVKLNSQSLSTEAAQQDRAEKLSGIDREAALLLDLKSMIFTGPKTDKSVYDIYIAIYSAIHISPFSSPRILQPLQLQDLAADIDREIARAQNQDGTSSGDPADQAKVKMWTDLKSIFLAAPVVEYDKAASIYTAITGYVPPQSLAYRFYELYNQVNTSIGKQLCGAGATRKSLSDIKSGMDRVETLTEDIYDNYKAQYEKIIPHVGLLGFVNPPTPADIASTAVLSKSIATGIGGTDSFNRELKFTTTLTYPLGTAPNRHFRTGVAPSFADNFSDSACREFIYIVNATYDDKWKAAPSAPGKPNLSNLTQTYSGQFIHLSRFLGGANTLVSLSMYHDNTQGIVYDFEPALGFFLRFGNGTLPSQASGGTSGDPKPSESTQSFVLGLAAQGDISLQYGGNAHTVELGGLRTYVLWQWKPKHHTGENTVFKNSGTAVCDQLGKESDSEADKFKACKDTRQFLQQNSKDGSRHTLAFNLRGFLPVKDPTLYGHASAMAEYDYKLTPSFSFAFTVLDSYYASVPAGYNHNSLIPAFNIKFTPQ